MRRVPGAPSICGQPCDAENDGSAESTASDMAWVLGEVDITAF